MRFRWRSGRINTDRTGIFDPDDDLKVKHTRVGVWDFYEERIPAFTNWIPGSDWIEPYVQMWKDLPFFWRMLKDLKDLPNCFILLLVYIALTLVSAMIPALTLW